MLFYFLNDTFSNSMQLVKNNYVLLEASISDLGRQVSGVLQKQEQEFLMAYKTHMRNVQKDFETLKLDIDEREKAIENNVMVKQIEKERDWYKRETLHLDQLLMKLKKRETMLTSKVEELEHDRSWLSNQLKNVMKQKNQLEDELVKTGSTLTTDEISTKEPLERMMTIKDDD